jgi:septal ring factor EnvC (AmiA/AmiB activator)
VVPDILVHLQSGVTELKQKRDELDHQIDEEENEKSKFEEHLIAIENKLQDVIQNLNRKVLSRLPMLHLRMPVSSDAAS